MVETMITGTPCVRKITHVLTTEHSAGSHMRMQNRPWYGISLAIDGEIIYKHNGNRFISDSRHIVILPKDQTYELECVRSGKFALINFLLDTDITLDTFQVTEISNPEIFLALHKKIESLFLSYQSSKYARTLSGFYEIAALIIEEYEKKRVPFVIKKAISLIETHIENPELSNTWLASSLHISESYLRKLFHIYLSTSPQKYVQALRFNRAEELLISSSYSISAISGKCGYSETGIFCRAFKKKYGVTPTEYRKDNRLYII